jgi:hypothetical protein
MEDAAFVDFLYGLFFDRKAEPMAQSQWGKYLAQGLPPRDLFLALWNSEEFKSRAAQNRYLRLPQQHLEEDARLISDAMLIELLAFLGQDRDRLLEVGAARSFVAQWRYRELTREKDTERLDADLAIPETVAYNESALRQHVGLDRSAHMIRPLMSIGRIAENMSNLRVLSIGPRTEAELLVLVAAGFSLQNISAIDLFTYSPLIQLGDMHDIDFPDNTFDVIVFGDVLGYSKAPTTAVSEILRVAKSHAIITTAHGIADPETGESGFELKPGLIVKTTDDVMTLFQPHIGTIYFRCEAENPREPIMRRVLTIFSVIK